MHKGLSQALLRQLGVFACLAVLLTALFLGSMLAVYAIPQRWIQSNAEKSIKLIDDNKVGLWPWFSIGKTGVTMDYKTDQRMFEYALREKGDALLREEEGAKSSALRAAQVPDYARYWHGYQVYLRPLLLLGDLAALRGWNILAQYAMIMLLASLIAKRLHTLFALCFGAALAAAGYLVVPLSFQFSSVFLVMLAASNLLLLFYGKPFFRRWLPQFFFSVGAVTVFLDLLTAPVITLGIPLTLLLLLKMKEGEPPGKTLWCAAKQSAAWGAGYAFLWFAKWCVASAVLKRN
ncbi:MAG: hypothetical protein LBQ33_04155, partial [Oscillospiraceae bacterium]|nr:hypothetical protein [Oscillospiraceae bacterium]